MKPNANQFVKIFFKNGLQVEGLVKEWGKQVILTSEESNNFMIITKPNQIIMYKIINKPLISNLPELTKIVNHEDLKNKNNEDYVEPGLTTNYNWETKEEDPNVPEEYLNAKSKVELYKLQIKEEREALAQKIKNHQASEVRKVEYNSHEQLPGFYKK